MRSKDPPSRKWRPMKHNGKGKRPMPGAIRCEFHENDRYLAYVHVFGCGLLPGRGRLHLDQTAVHDWRDLQRLKNDVVGEEWEAVEVYPSESCKVDPSNYYYLFCFPPGTLLNHGIGLTPPGRKVVGPADSTAPQRAFGGPVK